MKKIKAIYVDRGYMLYVDEDNKQYRLFSRGLGEEPKLKEVPQDMVINLEVFEHEKNV